jgi:hypothetical protein
MYAGPTEYTGGPRGENPCTRLYERGAGIASLKLLWGSNILNILVAQ